MNDRQHEYRRERFEQLQKNRRPSGAMTYAEAVKDVENGKYCEGIPSTAFYVKTSEDQ